MVKYTDQCWETDYLRGKWCKSIRTGMYVAVEAQKVGDFVELG